jgi:hypothetical protein
MPSLEKFVAKMDAAIEATLWKVADLVEATGEA